MKEERKVMFRIEKGDTLFTIDKQGTIRISAPTISITPEPKKIKKGYVL